MSAQPAAARVRPSLPRLLLVLMVGAVLGIGGVFGLRSWAGSAPPTTSAVLRLADGTTIGQVNFSGTGEETWVRVRVALPTRFGRAGGFHGLHIHANDDARNGNGCLASPADPPKEWFVSADAHFDQTGHPHAGHTGDLGNVYLGADRRGAVDFRADHLPIAELPRRTVVLHGGPDNLGHVPTGPGPREYTPNTPMAHQLTARGGNSGDRIACGVIELR
jgi:superoxide dismutase, Cu-Zn family